MRYRGYEIYVSRSDLKDNLLGSKAPRISCEIYMASDPDMNTMLDCFTLTLGEHFRDLSDQAIDAAIRNYVDIEYGRGLYATEMEVVNERSQFLLGRLITRLGESVSDQQLYDVLTSEIGMTDDEIRAAGASHLVPFFDRDEYARTIADHMIFIGTENTLTGSWEINYPYLNRKFYTDLPNDKLLMKKIGESLNHSFPENVQDFTIDAVGFHIKFNPDACHYVSEEDLEEQETNDMIAAEDVVEQTIYASNAPDCCSGLEQMDNILGMLGANIMDEDIYHSEDEHPGMTPAM